MKILSRLIVLLIFTLQLCAQSNKYGIYGTLYRFELSTSPFPAAERDSGHTYNGEFYSASEHYSDSTALVFVPKYLELKDDVDLVVYFHGWNNSVDNVLAEFKIIEQFYASGKNAVLVMPEGPKNASDSFGGKLGKTGGFKMFVDDVLDSLQKNYNKKLKVENITLAGHSGAYRVIAYIIMRGGLTDKIGEVFLFDGLYADVEKYSYWLDHYGGRFIDIYTPGGGTKRESENLMECLTAWGIPYTFIIGDDFSEDQLSINRIIFISSTLSHSEVISSQNQLKRFLQIQR